jgi:hypothetical protein
VLVPSITVMILVGATPSAYGAQQPAPSTSVQEAWSLPAEPSAGDVISIRPPGLYPSPDSSRVYTLLNRRSFGGYGCTNGGVTAGLQAIDAASGAVLSTTTFPLPVSAPVHAFAMDEGAQRVVVNTGCLDSNVWTSVDVATGSTLAQWKRANWPDRTVMGVDPNVIYVMTGTGNVANLDYRKVIEAVSTRTGATLWTSPLDGAAPYQGGWLASAIVTGRQYEGQPLAVSADGRLLYVLRSWAGDVAVLDTGTGASVGVIALPASTDLRTIVASPVSPRAFITDWTNSSINVIDTDSLSLVSTIPIRGRCLESMDIDATGELLAVLAACDDPRIILIRTSDGSTVTETPASADVTQVLLSPSGRTLVSARNASLAGYRVTEALPASKASKVARPIPAPLAPRSATAVVAGTTATVTWVQPANSRAAKVTGYRVTIRPGGGTCIVRSTTRKCVFRTLTPGRRYVFQVEARNATRYGLRADTAVTTVPVPVVSEPPAPTPTAPPGKPTAPIT